jgi:hypothetical protein
VIPRRPDAGIFKEVLMEKSVTLYCGDEPIGRTLTRQEFVTLDSGAVYDQLMECNWATVYVMPDGKLGIEDIENVDTDPDAHERQIRESQRLAAK